MEMLLILFFVFNFSDASEKEHMGMAYRRMVSCKGHILCALVREKYRATSRKCDTTMSWLLDQIYSEEVLLNQDFQLIITLLI